jgi:hypothetical protein
MLQINKDEPKRWFIVKKVGNTENDLVLFGNVASGNVLSTGQPELLKYLTEEELQTKVNEITGEYNYYEQAAIAPWENSKFNGVSVIYGEHIPPMPPPPEI